MMKTRNRKLKNDYRKMIYRVPDNTETATPDVPGATTDSQQMVTMTLRKNTHAAGKVYIAGAGPGDPDLMTVKAMRILQSADVVVFDRLVNPLLLDHIGPDARKISVGKKPGKASVSQSEINRILVTEARFGQTVLRLKGGDPFVFGRGGEECLALAAKGIPFEVIPGISSVTGATAYAGIPLTMRNLATGFSVISGHLHPDSPEYDWHALSRTATLVILMGARNLPLIIDRLKIHGKDGDTPIALIHQGTTARQQVATGTLSDIHTKYTEVRSPVLIVIGEVVRFREQLAWFHPETILDESRDLQPQIYPKPAVADAAGQALEVTASQAKPVHPLNHASKSAATP
jgi:uroporphyrin-III C-methyltransferase